jgi:hypothetical protein
VGGEVLVGWGRVNGGDEGEGIWLMGFKIEGWVKPLAIALSGAGKRLREGRWQGRSNQCTINATGNCHSESPVQ